MTFIRVDKSSNVSIVQCYFAFTIGFDSGLLEINIHIIKKRLGIDVILFRMCLSKSTGLTYKVSIQGCRLRFHWLSLKLISIINKGQELTSICSGYVYQESTKLTYNVHGVPGGQGARHSPGSSRTVQPSVAGASVSISGS